MSQSREFHMVEGNYNGGHHRSFSDTTYTKLFVGGLAWETQRDTMKNYFEQFGEILEAVVITDKSTGRSKGYGFVTFKDPEAAFRACQNPTPVIDGRRANCNIASFGVQKNHPPTTTQHVTGRSGFRASPGIMTPPPVPPPPQAYPSSSSYFHQPSQPSFPFSPYGYTGYPHDPMYQMNYYGGYGQQYSAYYPTSGVTPTGTTGYFHNFYPYYNSSTPYPQSSQGHGFGYQFPQMVQQYPFLPQPPIITTTGTTATVGVAPLAGTLSGPSQVSTGVVTPEQNSTT